MNIEPEVRDWLAALELAEAVAERNTDKVAAVYADVMANESPRLLPLLQAFVNVVSTTLAIGVSAVCETSW